MSGARALPSVSALLATPATLELIARHGRRQVTDALRAALSDARRRALDGNDAADENALLAQAAAMLEDEGLECIPAVINASGVILHTGLGRAALAEAARQALLDAAGHCLLEVERATGRRGDRQDHVRGLLARLSGAEDALVVNNNAAAVLLAVSALAAGGEVVVSRGELIEIGGSFRLPDIVRAAGAVLVEVGTTNRTRLADFAKAITDSTRLILRCHPSNYRIVGFVESAPLADLAELARDRNVPLVFDAGSGLLHKPAGVEGADCPTLQEAVHAGCHVVTCSGDKLLGGPQAGIALGRRECIERMARHPLARALRIDKLSLAALRATLDLHVVPETAVQDIPTLRSIARSADDVLASAHRVVRRLRRALPGNCRVGVFPNRTEIGGGSLPGEVLQTWCVWVTPKDGELAVHTIAKRLRCGLPAVIGRIRSNMLLLDMRTVARSEEAALARAVAKAVE